MSGYADVFEREEITPADLGCLTEEDLVSLGLALGPRRRLQKYLSQNGVR